MGLTVVEAGTTREGERSGVKIVRREKDEHGPSSRILVSSKVGMINQGSWTSR